MEFDIEKSLSPNVVEFRSNHSGAALNVDREARVIRNVILCGVGEAKGHEVHIEQSFIERMDTDVRKRFSGRVQCNVGHNYDNLFMQFGRFHNLRVEGTNWVGDLHAYKAADISPGMKDVVDWVFSLAEEDPKAIMLSIKFKHAGYYQYGPKRDKVYLQYQWNPQYKGEKVYVEYGEIRSCDLVESGALTDRLFSEGNEVGGAAEIFEQLYNAPDFMEFFEQNHQRFDKINAFYQQKHKFRLTNLFSSKPKTTPMSEQNQASDTTAAAENNQPPAQNTPPAQNAPATTDMSAAIEAAIKPLTDKVNALEQSLSAKNAEIEALKKGPAGDATGFQSADAAVNAAESQLWMQDPINQKVKSWSTPAKS